jgi:predicted ribosome-associated RNA-binding protein Tma20
MIHGESYKPIVAEAAKVNADKTFNRIMVTHLLMDWDEMSNLYRGPSIDASYQVSDHLAEGFQRHIQSNLS